MPSTDWRVDVWAGSIVQSEIRDAVSFKALQGNAKVMV